LLGRVATKVVGVWGKPALRWGQAGLWLQALPLILCINSIVSVQYYASPVARPYF